jgi:regulator of RNase E activity RraA
MLDAIDAAKPGSVYVMVLENGSDYAGIGGLMATAMKYRGLAGAVIDGSVRDTPQIRKLQFPVFSRGVVPSTTIDHFRVTGTNIPVTCAGVHGPGAISSPPMRTASPWRRAHMPRTCSRRLKSWIT